MNARNEEVARTVGPLPPPSAALDSLLGQTLADLKLIVSDNASTDRTAEICKDYAGRDARIRYIRQESNRKAMWNFNFVARQARVLGAWCARLG